MRDQSRSGKTGVEGGIPDSVKHELFAISLLLCTPSNLHLAWTQLEGEEAGEERWRTEINRLPFSDTARDLACRLLSSEQLVEAKRSFAEVGSALLGVYDLPEPHPAQEMAADLVAKIRELDARHNLE